MFHAVEKGWLTTDYLLAHLIDAQKINNWQATEGAHADPPRNIPEPFPRPGDEEKKKPDGVVSAGLTPATKTTVGEFLAMRAEREMRWRERNNKK